MIPTLVVFAYLGLVLYLGIFAFRKGKESGEDFFLAGRGLGGAVFLLSLFGSNMTAFSLLGSSGLAYRLGIGVYGLMASSSALVIPLTFLFIGPRLWSVGRRFGHMTQAQFLRDRWESGALGTVYFVVTTAMFVPYIVIAVMAGGHTLEAISSGRIPYALGGAIVALVVMGYVFFGGMRGTAWVNAFQSALFLAFGTIAFLVIVRSLGGLGETLARIASDPKTAPLLSRERIPPREFLSYMLIPLSTIMFPHISIMCLTAKDPGHFRRTAAAYPFCILALWAPAVFLGVLGAARFPGLGPGESDEIIVRLLREHAGPLLSGVLSAGILACVMASDTQIMALSTMFTEDVLVYYGGRDRFGDRVQVWAGRAFIVGITAAAYAIAVALEDREGIFELAVRFAFSGFAALSPVLVAALFWKRSTKAGALAATLWTAAGVLATAYLYAISTPGRPFPVLPDVFARTPGNVTVWGYLPVVPMVLGSAALMVGVSLLTRPPSSATIERYFPSSPDGAPNPR
jgi:SSS family solute:Na+ symporter